MASPSGNIQNWCMYFDFVTNQRSIILYYGSITCKTLGCAWSHKVIFDIMAFRFNCSFHKALALFFPLYFQLAPQPEFVLFDFFKTYLRLTSILLDLPKYGRPNVDCSRAFGFQKTQFYDYSLQKNMKKVPLLYTREGPTMAPILTWSQT